MKLLPLVPLPLPLLLIAAAPAPEIRLNQVGFLPQAPKRAVVVSASRVPLRWRLIDAGGRAVAQGATAVVGPDAASGDPVHLADFSAVAAPGRYRLEVGGGSREVRIDAATYAPLARASLNFFYQQRAGTPIAARFAGGPQWARAAGHPKEVAPCFAGRDEAGNDWPGCGTYARDVTGGWYDAGDHGKYVVNGGIALWTLGNLWEVAQPFADGSAALPEAGNGTNDLLDEAKWEMRFLLAMQVPDSTRMAVPVGPLARGKPLKLVQVDVGGMAHHKVADRHWTALPTIPAEDREDRLLYPPSTAATLNLAATAAQCARVFRAADPAFAAQCLTAARRAWAAAARNPELYAPQVFTGSGGYGDATLADEFFWAAAELWATTGEAAYRDAATASPLFTGAVAEPNWGGVAALGTMTLAVAPGVPAPVQAAQRRLLVDAADRFLAERARVGYRIPYATQALPWGSTSSVLNRAIVIGLAHRFTGDARYLGGTVDAADYILGRNPLDQSFVSGFGTRPLRNPHHRFWAHQLDARLPGPPPGVLSGGPNSTSFADPVALTLKGRCAPQRCWTDDIRAYAMNEVAINWNAPLVWVASYLDGAGSPPATKPGPSS